MSTPIGGEAKAEQEAPLKKPPKVWGIDFVTSKPRFRPGIVDLEPTLAPKPGEAKPKMPEAVSTNRHRPIPIDFGPVSWCIQHF